MKTALFALFICFFALPAHAGQAEAKELARTLNCAVASIAPTSMQTGAFESTNYKITCTLPEGASEDDKKNNGTLLIVCDGSLCRLVKKGE